MSRLWFRVHLCKSFKLLLLRMLQEVSKGVSVLQEELHCEEIHANHLRFIGVLEEKTVRKCF